MNKLSAPTCQHNVGKIHVKSIKKLLCGYLAALSLVALSLVAFSLSVFAAKPLEYTILETKPHHRDAFTQGLITQGEYIVETSGLYGKSFIQKYHADTHALHFRHPLPKAFFAEGLTAFNGIYYVLTWKKNTLLRFDSNTMKPVGAIHYQGEGWGLTHNNTHLIMSNGSSRLFFRNPSTFALKHSIDVRLNGHPIVYLNELEYAKNSIFSNVWMQNKIIQIDPKTGIVTGLLDLTGLAEKNNLGLRNAVLNGIAYDASRDAFWVTGKHWPNRYLISLNEKD